MTGWMLSSVFCISKYFVTRKIVVTPLKLRSQCIIVFVNLCYAILFSLSLSLNRIDEWMSRAILNTIYVKYNFKCSVNFKYGSVVMREWTLTVNEFCNHCFMNTFAFSLTQKLWVLLWNFYLDGSQLVVMAL